MDPLLCNIETLKKMIESVKSSLNELQEGEPDELKLLAVSRELDNLIDLYQRTVGGEH